MCTQVANDKRLLQDAHEGDLNAPTMQEMQHLVYHLFIKADPTPNPNPNPNPNPHPHPNPNRIKAARCARQAAIVRPALTKSKKEARDQHLLDVLFVVLLVALPPSRTQVLRTLRIGMSDKTHGQGSVDPPDTHRSWIAWVEEDSVYSIEVPKQKTGRSEDNRVPPEVTEYISDIINILGVKKAGYPSPVPVHVSLPDLNRHLPTPTPTPTSYPIVPPSPILNPIFPINILPTLSLSLSLTPSFVPISLSLRPSIPRLGNQSSPVQMVMCATTRLGTPTQRACWNGSRRSIV